MLLVIAALAATCGGPAPTSSPSPGQGTAMPTAAAPDASAGAIPDGEWVGLDLPPLARVADLEATRAVVAGALPDTTFRLTSLDGSDPTALAARLTVEPPLDLRVTRADATTAELSPAAPLRVGGQYRIALRDADGLVRATWAVQAVQPLSVVSTIPGNESTRVPRDTGIELTFNQDGVVLEEARPFLSIEPAVAGSFVQKGRTIAFVPAKPLARATLYRVTARHGLPLHGTRISLAHDTTVAFETAGGKVSDIRVTFEKPLFETPTSDAAIIRVLVDATGDEETEDTPGKVKSVPVTVHRLPSMAAAVEGWRSIATAPGWAEVSGTAPVATRGLPVSVDATLTLHRFAPDSTWRQWIKLPKLPAGWYLVTMQYNGVPRQAVVQVTDVAVYAMVTKTRTIAWVNDAHTGRPINDATAGMLGTTLGQTNAAGLVVARTPAAFAAGNVDGESAANDELAALVVRTGSRGAFVPVTNDVPGEGCCGEGGANAAWWVVFHPDRYQYRSTDTINAWAVVRSRESLAAPNNVEVRLAADPGDQPNPAVASTQVAPDGTGAAVARLSFRDLPYGGYRLQLVAGDMVLADRWISIQPIVKPSWTIALQPNRQAVLSGAKVAFTATARFFEGTPVAGARIRIGDDPSTTVRTNILGTATGRLRLAMDDDNDQWAVVGVGARPGNPEEGQIQGETEVAVVRSNVLIKASSTLVGTRLTITGSVHKAMLSRFTGAASPWDVDPYGKRLAGVRVGISIRETWFTRTKVGSTYDFVTKRTVPHYEYQDHARLLDPRAVRTNADGRFSLVVTVRGGDRSYDTTASAKDAAGRTTSETVYADTGISHEQRAAWIQPTDPGTDGSDPDYTIGSTVGLRFTNGTPATAASRYLWLTTQAGLRTWRVTDGTRASIPFTAAAVPGMTIFAVRFTGQAYEPAANAYRAAFRSEDQRVTVRLAADKARYAPGGRATVTIRTTASSGAPIATSVFVRAIDEKLYAMDAASTEDPLAELYAMVSSGVVATGWTHAIPSEETGGWGDTGGGEGGDTVRSEFRDALIATLVRTDANGTARVGVDLADDLTSWRVTASAVGDRLQAGVGTTSLAVGLPLFAEMTLAPEYLAVDRPVISLRGFGTGLKASDTVTFRVSSDTLPMAARTVRAKAFRPVEVALPALSVGTHRIRVVATTGSGTNRRSDTLERTFTVVASRLLQAATTSATLTASTPVATSAGMTRLTLSDAGRGRAVPVLQELVWADPLRADQTLAASLAARTLRERFGQADLGVDAQQGDLGRFVGPAPVADGEEGGPGGIAIVPHGSAQLELSVLAAMTDDARIRDVGLGEYFATVKTDTRERTIWALAGRAALGGSALAEIRALGSKTDLNVDEKIALAIAALEAGDEALAARLEREVLNASGEAMGPWVRLADPRPDVEALRTARLAIVAASLGDPIAAAMDAFVAANPPTDTVLDLERALAAHGWSERMPAADASATLDVGGTRTEVRIEASVPVTVALTPAQVRTARLEPGSGSVLVTTTVDRAFAASSLSAPAGQQITRKVTPGLSIKATDLVTVSLRVAVGGRGTEGCWIVTDIAPSGLMPLTGSLYAEDGAEDDGGGSSNPVVRPERITGQEVTFCVDRDPKRPTQTLRYLARVVTAGTYRWEPALIQSPLAPELGSVTSRQTLKIKPLTD